MINMNDSMKQLLQKRGAADISKLNQISEKVANGAKLVKEIRRKKIWNYNVCY